MFNQIQVKNLAKFLKISEDKAEIALKKQAKYIKTNPTLLLKSYKIIYQMTAEAEAEKAKTMKLKSRNILVEKYKEEIAELYTKQGYGYLKISKAIKLNHNANITKSAIENFIKNNELVKGNNG